MLRVILAFLVAPFLAWLSRGALFAPSYTRLTLTELAPAALHAAIPIYMFALPLGFGLFVVAWKFRRLSLLSAALAGAGIAAVFLAAYTLGVLSDDKLNTWYKSRVLLGSLQELLFGAWVGIIAWVLGIWRNPALWVKHPRQDCTTPNAP